MIAVILALFILSYGTFFFSRNSAYWYIFLLEIILWSISSFYAINVLITGEVFQEIIIAKFYLHSLNITIDKLSAVFILLINFTSLTSFIYAYNYLEPYKKNKSKFSFALHYFNFFMLNFAMLMVVMIQDALGFLLVWELMSLSSFLLVIFESEKRNIVKTGIKYLVQMHVGYLFIIAGFVFVYLNTGNFSFEGIQEFVISTDNVFAIPNSFWLFLLFFVGFGTKAGFFPFHAWLPQAHPAAPSHVSGLMSGIMIKMGIYGLVRVLFNLPELSFSIGIFIFFIAIFTGIFGIMSAIVQNDLKKLLAYSSIENIGIIGIGIGVGVLGEVYHQPIVAALGWTGSLFHIVNHSFYKSLLFYNAGSVYTKTHTRDMNAMGGLIKKMPFTAIAFVFGAIAISGLPPFNGFISEFLIYNGLFNGIKEVGLELPLLMSFGVLALALIGGLAMFVFTKAFGMTFLGTARSPQAEHASEIPNSMKLAKALPIFWMICIALLPIYFYRFISSIIEQRFPQLQMNTLPVVDSLQWIGTLGISLILGIVAFYFIRKYILKRKVVTNGATWGCGYSYANPKTNQYTSTSYAANFKRIAAPMFHDSTDLITYEANEIFPKQRPFKTVSEDKIEGLFIMPVANTVVLWIKKLAILQTGKIQNYIIYPLLFIIIIVVLTILKMI
jgi:formate hydrogenlyase subunit 3/multisubunit Na+/H+ antiporter MnhD subunit